MVLRKAYLGLLVALSIAASAPGASERFVGTSAAGVLEMRNDATVFGPEVRLRQVCRWADGNEGLFDAWGDLIVTRMAGQETGKTIGLVELRAILRDAGMNLSSVRFAGPLKCSVTRADAPEKPTPLSPAPSPSLLPTTQQAHDPAPQVTVVTLKERLTRELAQRLQLPLESLQISFNAQDEKLLGLSEPQFQFQIEPRRARGLGVVSWEVTAIPAGSASAPTPVQKIVIGGAARAWQDQIIANRPISGRQIIRAEDVAERRALVDSLPDTPLLTQNQVVGQQASMDLKPGAVLTANLVQAVPLARVGQLVTVTVNTGAVSVRTVAKAVDEGAYGQTIRVKNEGTKEIYDVTLTGPQQAVLGIGRNG